MKKEDRNLLPWMVLTGTIIVRGFATGLNTISCLFLAPVSGDLGIGIGTLSIYFSISAIVQLIWFSYAGKILNKYDVRWVAAAAICFQAISFAAFGFMKHVAGWYVLAVPLSMGAAVLVILLGPVLINRWFYKNTGTILGIQSSFVGLFGAVLQPVTSNMIEEKGWRAAYFSMGLLTLTVVLLAIVFLLRNKPKTVRNLEIEKDINGQKNETLHAKKEEHMGEIPQIDEGTAVRSASFMALLVFLFAVTGVTVFVQHIPTYGTMLGYSMTQIGTVLSFASIANAIGSFLIGFLSDKIGGLKTCYLIIGVWVAAVIGFLFGGSHFLVFATATFFNGLVTPSVMVSAPILTMLFLGKKDYEKIYAKVSMGAPLASIFLIPAYGFIYDITHSYVFVLFILLALLVLASVSIAYGWKSGVRRRAVRKLDEVVKKKEM